MKTMMLAVAFLAALPLAAAAQATKDDIKKLAAAGVGDEVILAFVRSQGGQPRLSADDVAELKKAGASDRVLQSLIAAPSEPAPAPVEKTVERVVERPVYTSRAYYETEPYYPVSYSFYPRSYYYPSYYSSYCYPSYGYYRPYYGGYGTRVGVGYYGGRWGVGIGFGYGGWCR